MNLSLIIPAYNEASRIGPFLAAITAYDKASPDEITEVLVVDDGSADHTPAIVQQAARQLTKIRLLAHPINRGKGAAVRTGVQAAQGDYIVFMDADGATPITELPKMTAALQQADIAIGNRFLPGAKTERHSFLRKCSGFIYRKYMSLFGLGEIDTMCGFKGYEKEIVRNLFESLTEERWLFDAEIAYKAVQRGYHIKNFPITWTSKDGSKLATKTLLKTAFQIWPLIRNIKKRGT